VDNGPGAGLQNLVPHERPSTGRPADILQVPQLHGCPGPLARHGPSDGSGWPSCKRCETRSRRNSRRLCAAALHPVAAKDPSLKVRLNPNPHSTVFIALHEERPFVGRLEDPVDQVLGRSRRNVQVLGDVAVREKSGLKTHLENPPLARRQGRAASPLEGQGSLLLQAVKQACVCPLYLRKEGICRAGAT